ncbi:dTDP-4-dehydrorhamnose 3,5-epimerase family protein [Cellulomonas carbonis]|uniref:dTDP-4-dehydrorhamnose 3,5-epimerase n=1 Tax=Cellulomonas carbonis T26 TaxID=947969 RepID=A0A0A0BM99_9CELL|nr:dTDP-4-dehydrorhamnose 3,5-epimerase [Cellulomonas carbonis]KGM09035.1 dTDP-4-dehydrorhamnose 3,5-epimerase [Cellulomonas carbonis T26]MDT0164729.1 dTDP-4-dehydrorhamnose 3,5-epimerase [Actinotalea sp. AC32]GGC11337.1 DTDP-4-dehydrorhamnose 3,5-epimerase RmlC [Cellulomonas carbonis]
MQYRELAVAGAWEITPQQFGDPRGVFLEWFKDAPFRDAAGHGLDLRQANLSVSAAGVVRGIHFADVPPGQAKYVTCARGAVLDVVVDIRVGSPTFGRWDSVLLDDVDRRAIYLPEGLGHAFMSLEDDSTVLYLCSSGYDPQREHGIHPLDPDVAVEWPTVGRDGRPLEPQLSTKDEAAPTLAEARERGLLPRFEDVQAYLATLDG